MKRKIVPLPKEQWKDCVVPIGYTSHAYYDVELLQEEAGFTASFRLKPMETPVVHTPEECDFADRLYADYWENAFAWGVVEDGKLLAAIETCPEEWNNRLRVTELWVSEPLRRQGVGHALMALAKEQARRERRRAVVLETQSCNVNAIGFYLHEGFSLIGFDACCYTNHDIERREVRLEMGWLRERPKAYQPDELTIRPETPEDYFEAEAMTRRAFWNKYQLGCNEHLFLHKLRENADYLPQLSRIAVADGKIVGGIWYSRAVVRGEHGEQPVLTFGPLCVDPDAQGRGVGERLLRETLALAKEAGYAGVVIYGEPTYYPRVGFKTCDYFGITTPDGKNFPAFMAYKLIPGALKAGRFYESEVFADLPQEELDVFDQQFPPMEKQHFPGQWS